MIKAQFTRARKNNKMTGQENKRIANPAYDLVSEVKGIHKTRMAPNEINYGIVTGNKLLKGIDQRYRRSIRPY